MSNINPDNGIWSLSIAAKRHKCDLMLAAIIGMLYTPESVIDVGCGDGRYCAIFKAYGWKEVVGFEGTKNIKSLGIYDNIVNIDLTKPLYPEKYIKKYDLVLCLEVGEHIPLRYEQIFINNLCLFVGKELILSWAPIGQYSASGHVNCRNKDYIIEQIEDRGLKYNEGKTNFLQEYASLKWLKENLMLFEKAEL